MQIDEKNNTLRDQHNSFFITYRSWIQQSNLKNMRTSVRLQIWASFFSGWQTQGIVLDSIVAGIR